MTEVRAALMRGKVVLSQSEFDYLVELARRGATVDPEAEGSPAPSMVGMALVGRKGGVTWGSDDEDLYGREDMKVRYR